MTVILIENRRDIDRVRRLCAKRAVVRVVPFDLAAFTRWRMAQGDRPVTRRARIEWAHEMLRQSEQRLAAAAGCAAAA